MSSRAVRVEKRKWDGSLAAAEEAQLLADPGAGQATVWIVEAGTERVRPARHVIEVVANDEVWLAVPGGWWVLCGHAGGDGAISEFVLHAATPFRPPGAAMIQWIDLDLDFEVHGDEIAVEDEAQFHDHARSMSYPDDVVLGAWSGISSIAPRYTTGDWPFDGSMERCLTRNR